MTDNEQISLLFNGCYGPDAIQFELLHGQTFDCRPASERQHIEKHWRDRLTEYRQCGRQLFNGPMCRLTSLSVNGGLIQVQAQETSYREYLYTRQRHIEQNSEKADPIGTCVIILTPDNHVLITRRSEAIDSNPGKWWSVGGFLDPADATQQHEGSGNALFTCVARETKEEINLDIRAQDTVCLGAVYDHSLPHPEFIFLTRIHWSPQQMTTLITCDEIATQIFIPLDNLEAFMEAEHANICPTFRAGLHLLTQARHA